ncbi:MAG: 30S ribosomal protein S4 [Spirochaetales bacterium]|nr:30S ribosomal protein S4 [Spirochaetales bacterium]
MNYTGPKVRLARRVGIALTPKAARIMERKKGVPGEPHTRSRRRQPSDYGRQLLEKQRLRYQYNIPEKQLRGTFRKAVSKHGNTGELLMGMLETRLDACVLRAGLARTIYAARQYVSHGHFLVNGRKVKSPGHRLKPGDTLQVRERSRKLACFREALSRAAAPVYLEVSKDELKARLVAMPGREEIPVQCDIGQVVEFYSR